MGRDDRSPALRRPDRRRRTERRPPPTRGSAPASTVNRAMRAIISLPPDLKAVNPPLRLSVIRGRRRLPRVCPPVTKDTGDPSRRQCHRKASSRPLLLRLAAPEAVFPLHSGPLPASDQHGATTAQSPRLFLPALSSLGSFGVLREEHAGPSPARRPSRPPLRGARLGHEPVAIQHANGSHGRRRRERTGQGRARTAT